MSTKAFDLPLQIAWSAGLFLAWPLLYFWRCPSLQQALIPVIYKRQLVGHDCGFRRESHSTQCVGALQVAFLFSM